MREPFERHARLLAGVQRWLRAQAAHDAARKDRRRTMHQARSDGYTVRQVAQAYGLSPRGVEKILNQKEGAR